jgi:hypothetical protein
MEPPELLQSVETVVSLSPSRKEKRSMPQRPLGSPLLSLCLALSLASCASAPPAATSASPKAPKAVQPITINLMCYEGARAVRFDKVGIPEGERPVDVALTRGFTWVLFDSGRVLQLSRGGERLAAQMRFLPVKAEVGAIAVDPLDDSVWIVSNSSVGLYRITANGQMSTVKLQRKVEGAGGFSGLVVARDAIYAQPTCADTAVWRLDRSGKVLGTAFNAPAKTEDEAQVLLPGGPTQSGCYSVRLERDAQGRLLAWDRKNKTVSQVDDQGHWSPAESPLFSHFTEYGSDLSLKGVDIGERSEQWYFPGVGGNLFFWKGKPVFVGNFTIKERSRGNDTVLYLPGEDREILMTCNGFAVNRVAADGTGYAALTYRFLILGDFASAPDLP